MGIRWRPMRPKDVRCCSDIIGAHPVISLRYGNGVSALRPSWLKLLGREAFRALVFEEQRGSDFRIIGCGVSVFVSDDFLLAMKKPPFFWVGPELVNRIMSGRSPLLSDKQVRDANREGGLNLVVWEGTSRVEDFSRPEVLHAFFLAFTEQHRGFLLKELISHSATAQNLEGMLQSGGLFLSTEGRYVNDSGSPLSDIIAEPHYLGLTRDLAQRRFGSWIGSLFAYEPPRLGFRPGEQRLLLTALRGGTDEELSGELSVSLSAIKKKWALIYKRASVHLPSFASNHDVAGGTSERGKEKKQRLLNYLRDHPEELRPASP